jgi:hypothetical protein
MVRHRSILLVTIITALVLLSFSFVSLAEPPELIIYVSPTCDHCKLAQEQVLPGIEAGYAGRLKLTFVDVSQPAGLKQLEEFETLVGQKDNSLPVFRFGDTLIANDDIPTLQRNIMAFLLEKIGAPAAPASGTPEATMIAGKTPEPAQPAP